MNVLSKLLDVGVNHGVFSYHPKCKKIQLTHLNFVDDLLIFTKGTTESIEGIKNILQLFYSYSGLQLNCAKSELYCCGISASTIQEMKSATGFRIGELPVRYLGMPLTSRKLNAKDCKILLYKILIRIRHWSAKLLSYVGRLQLIKSILLSM